MARQSGIGVVRAHDFALAPSNHATANSTLQIGAEWVFTKDADFNRSGWRRKAIGWPFDEFREVEQISGFDFVLARVVFFGPRHGHQETRRQYAPEQRYRNS